MTHALKTNPPYFDEVVNGNKNFELRKFDRPFATGDTLLLQEYTKESGYTGREHSLLITNVLAKYPGIFNNYCILSFKPVQNNTQ